MISGPNARFNLNSQDTSANIINLSPNELFQRLNDMIASEVEDSEKRSKLQSHVAEMREAQGTPNFKERYKAFIAVAADHLSLLSPFIPALTQLIQ